ncbi:MAG TPA: cation diffusion facilitator family transporter [Bryobacteraceae bacterium]|nr:cation diffusion facilitator family transporter [Bryobacteraceae bacterium]
MRTAIGKESVTMAIPRQTTELEIRKGIRSSVIGGSVNLSLALIKCLTGLIGHSFALIADRIESLSDVFSSSVVAVGLWIAIKPPDQDHPYGHGKAEPIAAIIVSLALVGAAISIAVESISETRTPHRLPEPYTLAVLLAVVVIKVVLSRYVGSVGARIESTAVKADAWHHLSDAITSALAFVGITIGLLTRNATADDWAALCASPIILFNGVRQIKPPVREILDTSPSADLAMEVRRTAEGVAGVAGLDKCYIRKVGFRYYVDLHVLVDGTLSATSGHRIAHQVKDSILAAYPRITEVLVHIEPASETRA